MDNVLLEFFFALRRGGLELSPSESIDAVRAVTAIGFERKEDLRWALGSSLVKRDEDLPTFNRVYEAFFRATGANQGNAIDQLRSLGFSEDEIETLQSTLRARVESSDVPGGFAEGFGSNAALDDLFARATRQAELDRMQNAMQVGFYAMRMADETGVAAAGRALDPIRESLIGALGDRGGELADAFAAELERMRARLRELVRSDFERRNSQRLNRHGDETFRNKAFAAMTPAEFKRVEEDVQRLAQKFRGALAVRRKRSRHGAVDVRRTLRRAAATDDVPMRLIIRRRHRNRPKLVVLADVSDSVRNTARFLLTFVYALQDAFARTRSFVFVSDIEEATDVFRTRPIEEAVASAYGGGIVSVSANSNYGRVWSGLLARFEDSIDRRTTVLIVGDARSNHADPDVAAFRKIATRARRVLWFNPEPRGAWGFGDSVMLDYSKLCTRVLTVHSVETLREAVDVLLVESL